MEMQEVFAAKITDLPQILSGLAVNLLFDLNVFHYIFNDVVGITQSVSYPYGTQSVIKRRQVVLRARHVPGNCGIGKDYKFRFPHFERF